MGSTFEVSKPRSLDDRGVSNFESTAAVANPQQLWRLATGDWCCGRCSPSNAISPQHARVPSCTGGGGGGRRGRGLSVPSGRSRGGQWHTEEGPALQLLGDVTFLKLETGSKVLDIRSQPE